MRHFHLKDDPGELRNLTSLLDPDRVTDMAFAEQERRMNGMVKRLVGRLGSAQARSLTAKYYRRAP